MKVSSVIVHQLPSVLTRIELSKYGRDPHLTKKERETLSRHVRRRAGKSQLGGPWNQLTLDCLERLLAPLDDIVHYTAKTTAYLAFRNACVVSMLDFNKSYWGWTEAQWHTTLESCDPEGRSFGMIVAYLLTEHRHLHHFFPTTSRERMCFAIFGEFQVHEAVETLCKQLDLWGYAPSSRKDHQLASAIYEVMFEVGSANVEEFTADRLRIVAKRVKGSYPQLGMGHLTHALQGLGIVMVESLADDEAESVQRTIAASGDVPEEWAQWAKKWFVTSTLTRKSRNAVLHVLIKAGRWISAGQPELADPAAWSRESAASWVSVVDRMLVGEWVNAPQTAQISQDLGKPLMPRTKEGYISAMRTFFRDCQEWGWIPRRFDPVRALATPRSVRALIGPDPRVIADDIWSKLMWGGLNLTFEDLPKHGGNRRSGKRPWYPLEMERSLALIWLFGGLRRDEILRLRVGCVRWQPSKDQVNSLDSHTDDICLLDVPVNKTGSAFSKPVDRIVGDAINQWERVRPSQPKHIDHKTGELIDFLFSYRGIPLGKAHINNTLIPLLCRKGNVPESDARGRITSHRARATIATQLYNAKDPMNLFELQAWLGHRSPNSTQSYARITPNTLTKAYRDAGYFARNVRTIEVLVDREAVKTGASSSGKPWQYFDLGHGFCTYDFFEQCPHRMACARCDFYLPKDSSKAQLLEAQSNLQRMRVEIPLTDDECAAVEDGEAAVEKLIAQLADVPTPDGHTPRSLRYPNLKSVLQVLPVSAPSAE